MQCYVDILRTHREAMSLNKYDLGLAKTFKQKNHFKDDAPVYYKHFKIPEATTNLSYKLWKMYTKCSRII
jgi:hypothetical protein